MVAIIYFLVSVVCIEAQYENQGHDESRGNYPYDVPRGPVQESPRCRTIEDIHKYFPDDNTCKHAIEWCQDHPPPSYTYLEDCEEFNRKQYYENGVDSHEEGDPEWPIPEKEAVTPKQKTEGNEICYERLQPYFETSEPRNCKPYNGKEYYFDFENTRTCRVRTTDCDLLYLQPFGSKAVCVALCEEKSLESIKHKNRLPEPVPVAEPERNPNKKWKKPKEGNSKHKTGWKIPSRCKNDFLLICNKPRPGKYWYWAARKKCFEMTSICPMTTHAFSSKKECMRTCTKPRSHKHRRPQSPSSLIIVP